MQLEKQYTSLIGGQQEKYQKMFDKKVNLIVLAWLL